MIVVIGGGPAGRIAAMRLAQAGKDVQLVEKRSVGGQCLHDRCMVVCALNDVARTLEQARTFQRAGILDSAPKVSFPTLLSEMRAILEKIASVLDAETREAGVSILYGYEGRIEGRRVFIDGEEVQAEAVIAATGSRAAIPDLPGCDRAGVYTYQNLSGMPDLPARIAVVGGGIVAAEFAHIFSALGSEVTLVSRHGLLPGLDEHLRKAARTDLAGVEILENAPLAEIRGSPGALTVATRGTAEIETDAVFLATGLLPRSESLQGVAKGPRGEVIVDAHMRTSVDGVYAAGDVIGPPYLTPVARMEGSVAADNILGRNRTIDYTFIPQGMSLAPEYAFCSSPEGGALTLGMPGLAGPGSFWAVPERKTGVARVSVDPETGQILGAAAAAPGASILLSYLSLLMRKGGTVDDFDTFLEIHPSTDSLHGLIRYTSAWLKNRNNR